MKNLLSFFLILSLIFLSGCSFDNKTGIWSGSEEEQQRIADLEREQKQLLEVVKIYSTEDFFSEEIYSNKQISLNQPKKNSSWQMSGLNLQNFIGNVYLSGINNNFLKKKIGKDKFSISKIKTTPLVYNKNIIFADNAGTIFSIRQNGKLNWKKNIYKKTYKKIFKNLSFSIENNIVFVADNVGFIYAVEVDTGKLVWVKNHGIPIKSNIKIFDNKIFLINQDNRLLCFDSKDGSIVWDLRSISSFIKTQNFLAMAISKEGDLLMLGSSGDLIKVNASNGQIYWSLNTTNSMLAHDTDFFKSSDIVISGNDIIFSTSSFIFSHNLNTGYFNWEKNISSKNTPIIDGDNIFVVSDNGYFVNIQKNSGEIIRSTNILKVLKKKKQNTHITGFIMGSGKIYAVSMNGYLIVCSAASGKVEYFKKIADAIYAPPIISDGSLYILTSKPKILGFN